MIKYRKLSPMASDPTKGTAGSAGYDLSACITEDIKIPPHAVVKIGTGLSIEPPKGTFGAVFPRSGLATKEGLRLANSVGVIDEDYRGEIMVAMKNDSAEWRVITPGERIAQVVFIPYCRDMMSEQDSLSDTNRGEGGFGSTGV